MRREASILLGIIREANRQDVTIGPVFSIIRKQLGITDDEMNEIAAICEADIREQYVNTPH